jgi:hypothetical protein
MSYQYGQSGPLGSRSGRLSGLLYLSALALVVGVLGGCGSSDSGQDVKRDATTSARTYRAPQDFSGIAFLEQEIFPQQEAFLVVHDAKFDTEERDQPRVSLVKTPTSLDGIQVVPQTSLKFDLIPNDLESVAIVPGRKGALLAESGVSSDPDQAMIYYITWDAELTFRVESANKWPTDVTNVEATAVASIGDKLWFLYAERADGLKTTQIRGTELNIGNHGTLQFGDKWTSERFTPPVPEEPADARPASALNIDTDGTIYVASAFDPGDLGPFKSAVWDAGTVAVDSADDLVLNLTDKPVAVAISDGLKIEAIALNADKSVRPIFIGMDDEDYGGALRPLSKTSLLEQ